MLFSSYLCSVGDEKRASPPASGFRLVSSFSPCTCGPSVWDVWRVVIMTNLEILRNFRETAQKEVDTAALKAEFAKVASKYFAPYRFAQLKNFFSDAKENELQSEINAFNKDTENGTKLLILLSDDDRMKANTITDKDGKVLFENVSFFAKIDWKTDKDGKVVRVKSVYSVPFIPMTANDNDRVINYWLQYRETVPESFAAIQEQKRVENENKIAALKEDLQTAALSGNFEKVAEIAAQIKELQK